MRKISIIIADDHQLFTDGLRLLFAKEENVEVTDIASEGKELLDILERKKADLILLDINMPKMNGLEALKRIREEQQACKIIILSTYFEEHLINKAISLGANGYMLKTISKNDLLQGIREVVSGRNYFQSANPTYKKILKEKDAFSKQFNLTNREREVINLIGTGSTNQQIANQLYLSLYTVETHRKNIMQKLDLKSPAALIRFIIDNGL